MLPRISAAWRGALGAGLLLALATATSAQTPLGQVSGVVTDYRHQPLADVTVRVVTEELGATTDVTGPDGAYVLQLPPGPRRTVVFTKPGYGDATADLVVLAGIDLRMNVQLFRILRAGSEINAPKKIVDVPALPPPVAREHDVHGVVVIDLAISITGEVKDATVLRGHPLLNQAALDAVQHWLFTPTAIRGEPFEVAMSVSVDVE